MNPSSPLKIVWVTPLVPYPPRDGGTIRLWQLIKGLARRNCIHVLALGNEAISQDDLAVLRDVCDVESFPHQRRHRAKWSPRWFLEKCAGLWNPLGQYHSPALAERLQQLTRADAVDLLILETLKMAQYGLPNGGRLFPRLVLSRQNYEPDMTRRMAQIAPTSKERALWWVGTRLLERLEGRVVSQFKYITAVSEHDANRFRQLSPSAEVAIVPNGVEIDRFCDCDDGDDGHTVMLLASMRYAPNLDSAKYFCEAIWPLIYATRPHARLVILGDDAPVVLAKELSSIPATEIMTPTGRIEQHLARATVLVVPLRAGAGTRVKILESLAARRAVVSTSVGCEGLDVISGRHLMIADQPVQFADAVIALLDDSVRRRQLGEEGRKLVSERYRWESAVDSLDAFCRRLAG